MGPEREASKTLGLGAESVRDEKTKGKRDSSEADGIISTHQTENVSLWCNRRESDSRGKAFRLRTNFEIMTFESQSKTPKVKANTDSENIAPSRLSGTNL